MKLARATLPPPARLAKRVAGFAGVPVVVWGDFVLDEYWRCQSRRVSREAPVLVLDYQERTVQGGGAAHAALNLAALGARVSAAGWVGGDAAGQELRDMLESAGIDTAALTVQERADTIVKTRVVAGSIHTARQQVVRVDRGEPFPGGAARRKALGDAVDRVARDARAIVLSDYGYGSVTPRHAASRIARWREARAVVALDARYDLAAYRGVTLATPNESEATAAAAREVRTEAELIRMASGLRRTIEAEHLIVTRGRDGLTLWGRTGGRTIPAWGGHEAVDVTGAGDAVVATAALALAVGASPLEAAALANVSGSVAVSRRGAVPVTRAELLRALRRTGGRVR